LIMHLCTVIDWLSDASRQCPIRQTFTYRECHSDTGRRHNGFHPHLRQHSRERQTPAQHTSTTHEQGSWPQVSNQVSRAGCLLPATCMHMHPCL
jgi:hypothetical protein